MSAESFINETIAKAIIIADEKTREAASYAQQAVDAANIFVDFGSGAVNFVPKVTLDKVDSTSLKVPDNLGDLTGFDALKDSINRDLVDQYAAFFADYFPNNTLLLDKAFAQLESMLESGNTPGGKLFEGIDEDNIWNRDRERILGDSDRQQHEVVGQWASRGFPMPPGAMQMAAYMITNAAGIQIGASSRERAIQRVALSVENVKFAIKEVLDYRIKCIQAVGDYIKMMALGPQLAAQLLTTQINAQAKVAEIIATFFSAKVQAASAYNSAQISLEQMRWDPVKTSSTNRTHLATATGQTFANIAQARSQAAMGAAQAAGQQGAAALGQLNAIAALEAAG